MSLEFRCGCGRLLQVASDLAGKRVRCPSCSQIVWAPAAPEVVPEARLVDAPQPPKTEPAVARVAAAETPPATPAVQNSCCAARHDGGAVGGFILSLGSLVFGVVAAPLFLLSWPVGGSAGALVSCLALRRIRAGRGNAGSAGLARAGVAIGVGQALLGVVLLALLAPVACRLKGPCGGKARLTPPSHTIVVPAQQEAKPVERCGDGGCGESESEER
ncbi:MAG: hypothetical protein IT452_19215 [Planctomycetia bacterium]|nr:hypothetical protein [Planctomycetia bacterium]